ncbi:MAG TPA: ATP-dependent zinc metalloprotease FtsH [Dehalococcoidia bacterium]|nr:ATP-dependent zinc metalloprotease FtsH [Dehalococcoidia bacterium]
MGSRWMRNSFVYLMILVAVIAIVVVFFRPGSTSTQKMDISQVLTDVKAGNVDKIEVTGDTLHVKLKSGSEYDSRKESGSSLLTILSDNNVDASQLPQIDVKSPSQFGDWLGLLLQFLPILIFIGLILFMMRQAQGSNSQAMSFGKSRARMFTANKPSVTFVDVAGVDEPKEELQEVVEFLKYPEKFIALGARIPRGVLLVGPPGTGKTLLARAVAGEAGVPFFSISGSEFVEMFVGVGASRVRDLFDQAKRNAPCIIFVDEIDAVGRQRGAGLGGSHDEREQTLNQILVEMDGFDTNTNVIVIAATNRPDILDPALLRPGRFDRQVVIDAPDVKGRVAILEVHTKGKPLDKDVGLDVLAKRTPGFSGADLANLVNEAAIMAARQNKKRVSMPDFEEAIDRVMLGPERKSRVRSARENEMVAYHESGHALVAYKLEGFDPLFKITIVSRGMAGGYTQALPEEDRHLNTRSYLEKMLAMMLGGHSAEEAVFGEMSTGASDDISKATNVARAMVTRYGMSERLGPRTFGRKEEMVFLGREISEQRDYSEKIAEEIDDEVRRIIENAHALARQIIRDNRTKLDHLAKRLMEVETLEGDALLAFMASPSDSDEEPPAAQEPVAPPPPPPSTEPDSREDEQPRGRPRPGLAWGG